MEQEIDNFFTWSWKCHWFDDLGHSLVQNVYLHSEYNAYAGGDV